jgi:hypothetical protein
VRKRYVMAMRWFTPARVVLAVSLVLGPLAPVGAAATSGPDLEGHWRCTGAGIPVTERSFYTVGPFSSKTKWETFSAADRTTANGPERAFEHITETPDGTVRVEAVEGNGTLAAQSAAAEWRFTGRSFDDEAPFTLTYSRDGESLHRVATRGTATVDDERCARIPDPPPVANCAQPNVPARTVHAVEPDTPYEAWVKQVHGTVLIRVVLDERSQVLWVDTLKSPDPTLTRSAELAARDSTYQTEIRNCRPIAAWYVFSVEYSS